MAGKYPVSTEIKECLLEKWRLYEGKLPGNLVKAL